jgi:hypothetical protein
MKLNEIALGRSVRYPFYSIFDVVQQKVPGQPGLKIRFKKKTQLPPEVLQSGIYAWSHPDWGYFYVGIASKNNFRERWYKHVQKLLDQCTSAKQMANWQEFSQRFFAAGYSIDDLKDITLRFFPIPADMGDSPEQFKKKLGDIEDRIVRIINPACNYQYDPTRPSSTHNVTQRPLKESSGYSLAGSFTHDLTTSKVWLLSELAKISPTTGTVYILGSWYGNLSLYMNLLPLIRYTNIINVEKNKHMLDQSRRMLDHVGVDNVEFMHKDANDLDYRQLGNAGVVINTSLTDMDGSKWFQHIPDGTLIAMQARDRDPGNQFDSPQDILRKFPLDQVLYTGTKELTDPETRYNRFMVIGRK